MFGTSKHNSGEYLEMKHKQTVSEKTSGSRGEGHQTYTVAVLVYPGLSSREI